MNTIQCTSTTFARDTFTLAADLYMPPLGDPMKRYPALVITGPGSSVKEQIAANYARALAARGFIVLTFDPTYQGASSGQPRDLESPTDRIADLRAAVDFLIRQDQVDDGRIGMLGVCAGGGYAAAGTMIDHRVKALGVVVPIDIGNAFRKMLAADDGHNRLLDTVAAQAIDEASGAAPVLHQWIPDTLAEAKAAGIVDIDMLQAITYYRTERGQHANSTNRRHYLSDALILGFDAFHLAGILLTQPVQVIVAGNSAGTTGSFEDGYRLAGLARAAQPVIEIAGARHYQMYDVPEYVDQAVDHLDHFFTRQLTVTHR